MCSSCNARMHWLRWQGRWSVDKVHIRKSFSRPRLLVGNFADGCGRECRFDGSLLLQTI